MTRTLSFLLKIQPPTYGKLITILSNIDGGGARPIIPKTILDQLEKEIQVLDVIAGRSSDGRQMTVMLTAPNEQNRLHLFAAKDINKFYLHNCPGIFPQRRGIFKSLMVIPTFDIKKLHPTIFSRHQCSHSNTLNKIQSSEPTEEAQRLSDGTTVTDSTTTPSEKSVKLIHGLPLTTEAQQLSDGTPSASKNQKQAVIDSTLTPSKENTNPINGLPPPSTEAQHLSDVSPDTSKNPNSATITPSKENTNPIDGLPPITKTQHLSEGTSPPDTSDKNPNSATTPSKENSTNPIDGLLPTTKAQQSSDQTLNTNKDPKPAVPDSPTIPATPLFPSTLTLPENFQMSINIGTTITVNYYGK